MTWRSLVSAGRLALLAAIVLLPSALPAAAQAPAAPSSYVGSALLRAPLGALATGDALLAYTRALLAPAGVQNIASTDAMSFDGNAPGVSAVIIRWWDHADNSSARLQMFAFERDLNAGCANNTLRAQHGGAGARVIVYTTTCTKDPAFQLWWLVAFDNERSRLLLLAASLPEGPALIAAGDRILAALGMSGDIVASPAAPPQAAPAPPPVAATKAPAATSPVGDIKVSRGLMSDKPFAVTYPATLDEVPGGDIAVGDAQKNFIFGLEIKPATPSLSADLDARSFNGPNFVKSLNASIPGARLIGNGMSRPPAGPAYVIHWQAPASGGTPAYDYLDTSIYDGGRQYRLSFAVRTSEYGKWRETVRFILANFSTTSEPRPCCAGTIMVP